MDEPKDQPTDCASHLVTLITTQDHICQSWLQHLITVQAGLIVGLGFLLRGADSGAPPGQSLLWFAVVAIPAVGIGTARALISIIVRERQWQAWYTHRFTQLPGGLPQVFPAHPNQATEFSQLQPSYISRVLIRFGHLLVIGWLLALCFLSWRLWSTPTPATPPTTVQKATP